MSSFYIKKTFVDQTSDIELVNIHYTWTPMGQVPNWEAHRETRVMPRGGVLMRGVGGNTVDETGAFVNASVEVITLPDDGTRRKILRLDNAIADPATGAYSENYALHHYFETFRQGQRELSPLFTEEIVTREVEYIDYDGTLGGTCAFWSVYDWDAPQYSPTEEPRFIDVFGEDNPFRSHKLYATEDKDEFMRIRTSMLAQLPLPRHFVTKVRGPRGAQIHQCWHVAGGWSYDSNQRWEDYVGYTTYTL